MGKMKKKGESGAATNYISRNQALKKLQLTLADFRYEALSMIYIKIDFNLLTTKHTVHEPEKCWNVI